MLYSASTNAFYDELIHGDSAPTDCVEVSDSRFSEILLAKEQGKVVVPDNLGNPTVSEPPEPTIEQEQRTRNESARRYLRETDWYVLRKTETGIEIPQEIIDARSAARASVVE